MKLSELIENPGNPSIATSEELKRLEGKIMRVQSGLKAIRIAYVTDMVAGKKVVLSGNKRLRVLKKQFGEDAELPDDYFQDITDMSQAERHEFIVTANVSDGAWDVDKLLQQYDIGEVEDWLRQDDFAKWFGKDIEFAQTGQPEQAKEKEDSAKTNETHLGQSYMLGNNIIVCGDVYQVDELRKYYAKTFMDETDNWKDRTPAI